MHGETVRVSRIVLRRPAPLKVCNATAMEMDVKILLDITMKSFLCKDLFNLLAIISKTLFETSILL